MFVFAPAPQAVVPVSGEKNVFFPVNRVYAVLFCQTRRCDIPD